MNLPKDRVKPAFRSKRRSRSVKSVSLRHDNAGLHTASVTRGTLEEMHWELQPQSAYGPDLALSNIHLFCPFKRGPRRKNT